VHEDVVADLEVGQVRQAHLPRLPGEVRAGHPGPALLPDLDDPSRNAETHGHSSFSLARSAATTACPRASPPSLGGTTRWVSTSNPADRSRSRQDRSSSTFWNTPPVSPASRTPCSSPARVTSSVTATATASWKAAARSATG